MSFGGYFDLENKIVEISNLEKEIEKEDFWNDQKRASEIISKINSLKVYRDKIYTFKKILSDKEEEIELLKSEYDSELSEIIETDLTSLEKEISDFELFTLLNKEFDKNNCVLEIHSGAGGTESCDWVNMLYRMYTRWCEQNNYKYELIDKEPGEEVGYKSISILIKGDYAYGYLKCEKGIHRLVRLSPFDSNNRRHTSFASVDVIPEIEVNNEIEIDEKDLKIDVYRSSGAGGQHVNTTDSAVRITHLPTKTVVTCQNGRSQIQNKEQAMQMLKSKLLILKKESEEKLLNNIRGEQKNIEFGSQIRSYVMHPYSLVKDHRTNEETSNVLKVLDGDIDIFINSNLRRNSNV